jgi:hypothetical protein
MIYRDNYTDLILNNAEHLVRGLRFILSWLSDTTMSSCPALLFTMEFRQQLYDNSVTQQHNTTQPQLLVFTCTSLDKSSGRITELV